VLGVEDDYLELIRRPRYGYGKGANPCVDCRIYMFQKAQRLMEQLDAQFLVSGEVVGQRPMSQKRNDLDVIAYHSDLEDLLLRPLSAKLLRPTLPEREGWVDREQLYDFTGRSRKGLIALAEQLGLPEIPQPSTGCALTEPLFSRTVFDLLENDDDSAPWDFELLKTGRHFRFDAQTKVIVGRREEENDTLTYLFRLPTARRATLIEPHSFVGPVALVVGPPNDEAVQFAGALLMRYGKQFDPSGATVKRIDPTGEQILPVEPTPAASRARTLAAEPR